MRPRGSRVARGGGRGGRGRGGPPPLPTTETEPAGVVVGGDTSNNSNHQSFSGKPYFWSMNDRNNDRRRSRLLGIAVLVVCWAALFQKYWLVRTMECVLPWGGAAFVSLASQVEDENATDTTSHQHKQRGQHRYYAPMDRTLQSNDRLCVHHGRTQKIYATLPPQIKQQPQSHSLRGPETIVFRQDGTMFVLTEDAKLFRVDLVDPRQLSPATNNNNHNKNQTTPTSMRRIIHPIHINATLTLMHENLGGGRPLGGRFANKNKNTLYMADAVLGLVRLQNVNDPRCKVEIVASSVRVPNAAARSSSNSNSSSTPPPPPTTTTVSSEIRFADDVVIGPRTGRVYFTDATDIRPDFRVQTVPSHSNNNKKVVWETLYTSKVDCMRGLKTGRLLQYDPHTDETTVLASGFHFANGIAVDKDETFLVFAETFGVNLLRYNLQNRTTSVLIHGSDLPGYLDGVDCSSTTGLCYAVMPSAIVPAHKFLYALPSRLSQILRTMLMMLPRFMTPPVKKLGGLIEVNPNTKEFRFLLDPTGKDIAMLTGVTVHKDKLYLGSLENDYIGVYHLEQ